MDSACQINSFFMSVCGPSRDLQSSGHGFVCGVLFVKHPVKSIWVFCDEYDCLPVFDVFIHYSFLLKVVLYIAGTTLLGLLFYQYGKETCITNIHWKEKSYTQKCAAYHQSSH